MTPLATGVVLLVEDDDGTRGMFEAALIRSESFDLVVLDLSDCGDRSDGQPA